VAYDDLPLIWEMVALRDQGRAGNWHSAATKLCKARGIPLRRVQSLRKKAAGMERAGTLPPGPPMPREVAAGVDEIYARILKDRAAAKAEEAHLLAIARESGLDVPAGADAESLAVSLRLRLGDIKQQVSYSTDQTVSRLVNLQLPRSDLDRLYAELKAEEMRLERQVEILDGIVQARKTQARTKFAEDW
jgi:hypothetical protein